MQNLFRTEVVVSGVTSIRFQSILDNLDFLSGKEWVLRLVNFVGEVYNDDPPNDCKDDWNKTFDDEDPAPATVSASTVQFVEAVCKEISKPGCEDIDGIEASDAFLDLVALVPAGDEEETTLSRVSGRVQNGRGPYIPGKNPASKTPTRIRTPTMTVQSFAKAPPRMTVPHAKERKESQLAAPNFRMTKLEGISNMKYGMKNMSSAIE